MLQRFNLGEKNKTKETWNKFWSIKFAKSPIMPFHFIQFLWKAGEMMHIYQCGVILYSAFVPLAVTAEDKCQSTSNDSRALPWVPLPWRRAAPVIIWSSWTQSLKFSIWISVWEGIAPSFSSCAALPLGSRVCRKFLPWTLPVGFANIQAEDGHPEATPKQLCF